MFRMESPKTSKCDGVPRKDSPTSGSRNGVAHFARVESKRTPDGKLAGKPSGAGRKKGGENASTRERRLAFQGYRERVQANTQRLLDSQLSLASGINFLYHRETVDESSNVVRVIDETEITQYLSGAFDCQEDVYYFITTEKPDNRAIADMLDRTYGRAPLSVAAGDAKGIDPNSPEGLLLEMARQALPGMEEERQEGHGSN